MHLLRHVDQDRFAIDFLVHNPESGAYDEEIRTRGSRLIVCPKPQRVFGYARRLAQILRQGRSYDVLHSHVHLFSGVVLSVAARVGVPSRIAHSHSDTSSEQISSAWWRRLYGAAMRRSINRHATAGVAASERAAVALWGAKWHTDPRWQVIHCGIDLTPYGFQHGPNKARQAREQLGIPDDSFVVGHVGSFTPPKNHKFLLDILAEVARKDNSARLVLVGDGPLRHRIVEMAASKGVSARVIMAGIRADVAQILMDAVDVFVFPSLYEGLPLAVVEAQAAGLPIVISDRVTPEVEILQELFMWRSPEQPAREWAEACLACRDRVRNGIRGEWLRRLESSQFNIQDSARHFEDLYLRECQCLV